MASYITITDAETDPGAPATSELAKKWRDNPIAMFEGATGAPKLAQNIRGASGTTITFTSLGAFSGALLEWSVLTASSGSTTVALSLSDNGTTFYGSTNIVSTSVLNAAYSYKLWIHFPTGAYTLVRFDTPALVGAVATGTITGSSLAVVSLRLVTTGTGASSTAVIMPNGGIL